ncbi:MAG: hypothetical protein QHJ73_17405, partial [Armatimonadota bacterium]|nr:hypothetical protein [Armatimonadota bacterium]
FEQSGLAARVREDLRVANADALVLVTITSATGNVSYTSERRQLTPDPPPFTEPEPRKPSPTAREYGFMGPRVYPQGENDPKYHRDVQQWEARHRAWVEKKAAYEASLRQRPFDWSLRTIESGEATVQATIRVFDLASGAVVWASQPVEASEKGTRVWRERQVQVVGTGVKPDDPPTPPAAALPPESLVTQAVTRLGAQLVRVLQSNVLLPASPADTGTETPSQGASGAVASAPAKVEGAVGHVLEVRGDGIVVRGGTADGVREGDLLMVLTEVEVRRDLDGTVLETLEKRAVPVRVVRAYARTADCQPLRADDLGQMKPGQPVRPRREGDPGT